MRKIKDILRLRHEAKLSYRGIAQALDIGYGTVVDYLKRADQAQLQWPLPDAMDERDLGLLWSSNFGHSAKRRFSISATQSRWGSNNPGTNASAGCCKTSLYNQ